MSKQIQQVDILIVGGGLTGAALLLALQNQDLNVLLVDAQDFKIQQSYHFDARSLALAPSSIKILQALGVWSAIAPQATPIRQIHVSQQGRFGVTRMHGEPDEPLGHVVELQHLGRAIHDCLPKKQLLTPARLIDLDCQQSIATIEQNNVQFKIQAKLIVAADGGQSAVRSYTTLPIKTKTYPQSALIANIALKRSHHGCAYERFTKEGPLAMLPMTRDRAALIWCLPPEKVHEYCAANEADFLKTLQLGFGYRLGRFMAVGQRSLFPLQEIIMPIQGGWPLVFIGNAAHTLHPVAGQGFNLGLRDVATLAQCIVQKGLNPAMLLQYQALREVDQTAIIRLTDGLIELFGCQWPGLGLARSLGLLALDNTRFLQTQLSHYARGFGGVPGDLVCGISLNKSEPRVLASEIFIKESIYE